jgi:hypothetical protein
MVEVGLLTRAAKRRALSNAGGLSAVWGERQRERQRPRVFAPAIVRSSVYSTSHRFPEPCGHSGFQPSPKLISEAREKFRDIPSSRDTGVLPGLPLLLDGDDGEHSRREPLALKETPLIRELLELIAALDRRVPRAERANEMSIAGDAAALKAKALRRVAELEREQVSAERP